MTVTRPKIRRLLAQVLVSVLFLEVALAAPAWADDCDVNAGDSCGQIGIGGLIFAIIAGWLICFALPLFGGPIIELWRRHLPDFPGFSPSEPLPGDDLPEDGCGPSGGGQL